MAPTTRSPILQAVLPWRRARLKNKWNTRLPSRGASCLSGVAIGKVPYEVLRIEKKKGKIFDVYQVSSLCVFLPGESFPLPSTWASHAQLSQLNLSQSRAPAHANLTHFPSPYMKVTVPGHSFSVANACLLFPYVGSFCVPASWHRSPLIPTKILPGQYCQAQRGWGHAHEYQFTYSKLSLLKRPRQQ